LQPRQTLSPIPVEQIPTQGVFTGLKIGITKLFCSCGNN
jgi:hypothetical protein